jgi:hypothetical protein
LAFDAHILLPGAAKLAPTTPDAWAAYYPVTYSPPGHALAQGSYFAGRLDTQNVGQPHPPALLSAASKHVQMIQATGPHANQNLAWARLRGRKILIVQHFWAATLVHHNCLQSGKSSLVLATKVTTITLPLTGPDFTNLPLAEES